MPQVTLNTNIIIDACCLLLAAVGIAILFFAGANKKLNKALLTLFICLSIALVSNLLCVVATKLNWGVLWLQITTFSQFFFTFLVPFIFTLFILCAVEEKTHCSCHKWHNVSLCIVLTSQILLIVSQFTNWLYYADGTGVHHGNAYWLETVMSLMDFVLDSVVLILFRKRLIIKQNIPFYIYVVLGLSADIINIFIPVVAWTLVASTISAIIITACFNSTTLTTKLNKR